MVAMEAISGGETIHEIAANHAMDALYAAHITVRRIQVSQWKRQLFDRAGELFTRVKQIKINDEGQATPSSTSAGNVSCWAQFQTELPSKPLRGSTVWIMVRIDTIFLEEPCSCSRRMVGYLARDEIPISRNRVQNLMRSMGLPAIYQKPRTTVPRDPSESFPCVVDLSKLTAVDQVWATDIT